MTKNLSPEEIALTTWGRWPSNADGTWPYSVIQAAAAVYTAQTMRKLVVEMAALRADFLSLGRDGIHALIREEAFRARRRRQRRLASERAKRLKAKTARKGRTP